MSENVNFLCEIGTEEIPAGYMLPAIDAIEKIITDTTSSLLLGKYIIELSYNRHNEFNVVIKTKTGKENAVPGNLPSNGTIDKMSSIIFDSIKKMKCLSSEIGYYYQVTNYRIIYK